MKLSPALTRLVPSAALALACAWSPAAWSTTNLPFVATAKTQETLKFEPTCPSAIGGSTTGTGVATQMSVVTLVATDCVTPNGTTYTFSNGVLTLTASNGDELTASYYGTLLPLVSSVPTPIYIIDGRYTVTGGTGRLTGATGSGYLKGVMNLQTGQGQYTLTGMLAH